MIKILFSDNRGNQWRCIFAPESGLREQMGQQPQKETIFFNK